MFFFLKMWAKNSQDFPSVSYHPYMFCLNSWYCSHQSHRVAVIFLFKKTPEIHQDYCSASLLGHTEPLFVWQLMIQGDLSRTPRLLTFVVIYVSWELPLLWGRKYEGDLSSTMLPFLPLYLNSFWHGFRAISERLVKACVLKERREA